MAQQQDEARKKLLRSLIDKVAEDTYPSATMMDTIEEMLTPEEFPEYVAVILERIANDRFPSHTMIERVKSLTES